MATAGNGKATYEGGGAGKRFRKRTLRPEINEEPQNISQEAGEFKSSGGSELSTLQGGNYANISSSIGISKLEQILKHKTFTRSEIQRLIELLHSRITEESASDFVVKRDGAKRPPNSHYPVNRLEASKTSGSLKKHKHADKSDNFHALVVGSRVLEEQIGSPIGTSQEDSEVFNDNIACLPKAPMASPQHPATMENFPGEILSNIFIRLLAKQLAQMRCISKSWNALLSQPSFVKSHLDRSLHHNDPILLVFYDEEGFSSDFKPVTAHLCRSPELELTNFIKLPVNPIPRPVYTNGLRVIGCVNGLICYSHSDSVIHIWNPSLSAVLTLPPYSMPRSVKNSISIYFRFGFDPKTDDYKVVKLTVLTGPPKNTLKWWLQIEIYSMRNGYWEVINEWFPSHIRNIRHHDYACVDGHDGHIHWLGYTGEKYEYDTQRIVAFDLGSHTFNEIPLPDSVVQRHRDNQLGVLAKKLCVITRLGFHEYEVWVMDEYGVAESWVKRHRFSQFDDCACPFGFTSHNDFVFVCNGCLILYDLVAKKETNLEHYCPSPLFPHNIVEFVDSLVWIEPARRETVQN